jgi:hypothetical protein
MKLERESLEERKGGCLAKTLGRALPGESQEKLDRLAEEDQRRAEAGLVALRSGGRTLHKHVDSLVPADRQAMIEAEKAREAWLVRRLRGRGPDEDEG